MSFHSSKEPDFSARKPSIQLTLVSAKELFLLLLSRIESRRTVTNLMIFILTVIETACGDYGREYVNRMIELVENGRVSSWTPAPSCNNDHIEKTEPPLIVIVEDKEEHGKLLQTTFDEEINAKNFTFKCSGWEQFMVLFRRSSKQIIHNKDYMRLRFIMHIILGLVVGGIYWQIGNDGSKQLFNFGFCFTIIIAFLYIPMMPNLLECEDYSFVLFVFTIILINLIFVLSSSNSNSNAEERAFQSMVSMHTVLFFNVIFKVSNSIGEQSHLSHHGMMLS